MKVNFLFFGCLSSEIKSKLSPLPFTNDFFDAISNKNISSSKRISEDKNILVFMRDAFFREQGNMLPSFTIQSN
jgi:hypothetical protein